MVRAPVSRPIVKVCGFTREEDVRASSEAGVHWLGFNLWPGSKRYVRPDQARSLVAAMSPEQRAVGIFVDASPTEVLEAATVAGLHAVQLHGSERAEDWRGFSLPVIKALRVDGPESLLEADAWDCEALLLDAPGPLPGGNGTSFAWELAVQLSSRRQVLVAGGLNPGNVAEAVRASRPYGVDVASGVECSPGIKDAALMMRFAEAARSVCE